MSLKSRARLHALGEVTSAKTAHAGRAHTQSRCTCPASVPAHPVAVQVLAGNAGAASSAAASAQANAQAVSSTAVAKSGNCTDAASRAASYAATASAFAAAASAAGASSACQTGGANLQVPLRPIDSYSNYLQTCMLQRLPAAQWRKAGGHTYVHVKPSAWCLVHARHWSQHFSDPHAIQAYCAVPFLVSAGAKNRAAAVSTVVFAGLSASNASAEASAVGASAAATAASSAGVAAFSVAVRLYLPHDSITLLQLKIPLPLYIVKNLSFHCAPLCCAIVAAIPPYLLSQTWLPSERL